MQWWGRWGNVQVNGGVSALQTNRAIRQLQRQLARRTQGQKQEFFAVVTIAQIEMVCLYHPVRGLVPVKVVAGTVCEPSVALGTLGIPAQHVTSHTASLAV